MESLPEYGIGDIKFIPNPDYTFPLVDTPIPIIHVLTYSAIERRLYRWIAEGYPNDFCLAELDDSADPVIILQTPVVGFTICLDNRILRITSIQHPQ